MTFRLSTAARNAQLNAIEATAGASAVVRFYTGAAPANCAAAATGTMLCSMPLPADWMADAAAAAKAKAGIWTAQCAAGGNVGYYRIWDAAIAACHMQGSVTATGGGGDMEIDNPAVVAGQSIVVSTFNMTAQNA